MRSRLRRMTTGKAMPTPLDILGIGNATQWFWLDFTDPTSWAQNSDGTVAATSLGDPVGFVRDKSGQGYNAPQTTSAARPTHGRMPKGGVRNRFIRTQQMNNAIWNRSNVTVIDDYAVAPDGTTTGSLVSEVAISNNFILSQATSYIAGESYTLSVYLRKGPGATAPNIMQLTHASAAFGSQYANVNVLTGEILTVVGATVTVENAAFGGFQWWRFTYTATATSTLATGGSSGLIFTNNNDGLGRVPVYAGSTTSNVYAWGMQFERGNATPYQKVVQAYDVTEAGVPSVSALWFDGVDDHFNMTSTSPAIVRNTGEFRLFTAGLHTKRLDSTQFQFVATMSAIAATRATLGAAATNISAIQARRTAADSYAPVLQSAASMFVGYVRSAILSYATGLGELRVNGVITDSDPNFFTLGNTEDSNSQSVYIGRSVTSYFGGFMSSIVGVKGVVLSEIQLTNTERFLMNQIGVTA